MRIIWTCTRCGREATVVPGLDSSDHPLPKDWHRIVKHGTAEGSLLCRDCLQAYEEFLNGAA